MFCIINGTMKLIEKLYKRNKIHAGKAIDFVCDTIILPNGKKATREYTVHPGAVAVIPLLTKTKLILVKQYRYPVKQVTYELPAGKLLKGENPYYCVKRELAEETGYKAKTVKKLITFWPAPAFSTELLHVYVAEKLTYVGHNLDEDEFLDRKVVSMETSISWVKHGKIRDSKSIIGLLTYFSLYKGEL